MSPRQRTCHEAALVLRSLPGCKVKRLSPYHLRVSVVGGRTVDYWPSTRRALDGYRKLSFQYPGLVWEYARRSKP